MTDQITFVDHFKKVAQFPPVSFWQSQDLSLVVNSQIHQIPSSGTKY